MHDIDTLCGVPSVYCHSEQSEESPKETFAEFILSVAEGLKMGGSEGLRVTFSLRQSFVT